MCPVLIGFTMLLVFTFGMETRFLLNTHYSAKTLHVFKQNNKAYSSSWNSLGIMSPYIEHQVHDREQKEDAREYNLYDKSNFPYTKWDMNTSDFDNNDARTFHVYNPDAYTMYINNPWTFSVLSSISPSVYLITLLTLCQLTYMRSISYFMHHLRRPERQDQILELMPQWKHIPEYITLVISFALLFIFFARQGSLQSANWEKTNQNTPGGDDIISALTIEYMSVPQIPSIVYSLIIFALYYMHLKRTDKYEQLDGNKYYSKVDHSFWSPFWDGVLNTINTTKATSEQQRTRAMLTQGQQFNTMNYGVPLTFQLGHFKTNLIQQKDSSSDFQPKEQPQQKESSPDFQPTEQPKEPVTNEISIFVCVIILLGGLADLGLLNGFILELEAQLVIISLISFCLLEIVLSQFHAYFEYLNNYWQTSLYESTFIPSLKTDMTRISLIVDFTVLTMQTFIFLVLQYTRSSIIIIDDSREQMLNVYLMCVIIGYMLLKLVIWVLEVLALFKLKSICCGSNISDPQNPEKARKFLQVPFYYISVWFLWITVIIIVARSERHSQNDERKLVFNEQIMYERANTRHNAFRIGENDLSYSQNPVLSNCEPQSEEFLKTINAINALKFGEVSCSESTTNNYKIANPIVMKVWAWTRFLVLQNQVLDKKCEFEECAPASEVYCNNGFEQHWDQCKNSPVT